MRINAKVSARTCGVHLAKLPLFFPTSDHVRPHLISSSNSCSLSSMGLKSRMLSTHLDFSPIFWNSIGPNSVRGPLIPTLRDLLCRMKEEHQSRGEPVILTKSSCWTCDRCVLSKYTMVKIIAIDIFSLSIEWRFGAPGSGLFLKKWKNSYEFQKYWKRISNVANGVSYKSAKNQLQILYILNYTKIKNVWI